MAAPAVAEAPARSGFGLKRGGKSRLQERLDKQAAILPLIGQLKLTVVEAEMDPESSPLTVGRELKMVEMKNKINELEEKIIALEKKLPK